MGIARKISLTEEGKKHPMYEGKNPVFDAFTSHNDEVCDLGHSAVVIIVYFNIDTSANSELSLCAEMSGRPCKR